MKPILLLHAFAQHNPQQLNQYSEFVRAHPGVQLAVWDFAPSNQHQYIRDSLQQTINMYSRNRVTIVPRDRIKAFTRQVTKSGRSVFTFKAMNQEMDSIMADVGIVILLPLWFMTNSRVQQWYQQKKGRVLLQQFYRLQVQSCGIDIRYAKSRDTENRTYIPKGSTKVGIQTQVSYIYNHQQAIDALEQFVGGRFKQFAKYQDAVIPPQGSHHNSVLVHSGLSMAINTGLILPQEVLTRVCAEGYSRESETFVRQLLGWREFAICYYQYKCKNNEPDVQSRFRTNKRRLSKAWYKKYYIGQVKAQLDDYPIIRDILVVTWDSGYIHHIPRLYLLSFMIQLELHPREIYNWMTQHFIDANDWVMVFNVYAMGGFDARYTSKTYLFSSGYYVTQSDGRYKRDAALDSLYRAFLRKHPQPMRQGSDVIDVHAVTKLKAIFTQ